mmetsp:Transcript_71174/g.208904  ORF Transcript_71174/g.208904 Transcript_71174/m.208904 type:complete len:265 (+) Transcript_71174:332-1126(+)
MRFAPLRSHHLLSSSQSLGDLSCCRGSMTKMTASFAPASRASCSSSSSRARRSLSSRSLCSISSSVSSWGGASSSGSEKLSGSSCLRILSCHMSTSLSPHMSRSTETTMGMSLPVSPQTTFGPSAQLSFSFSSRHSTPMPLSKEGFPPTMRGKISMSVPVSCMSRRVPSGSSSSLTRRTSPMKRRLSGSATVPAGSFRAMVISPNFRCSPEPMPRNFALPGSWPRARMRRCSSSTSSRCSCGSSSASSTRCDAGSKYSRPLEPV